ncbi:MipA/OmpV family protein [Sphaerotilus mobilis]|nr:MipA/OmpV family protein [Sphaerotilus mobilis]
MTRLSRRQLAAALAPVFCALGVQAADSPDATSAGPRTLPVTDGAAITPDAPARPVMKALPLWELGVGASLLRLPDYRGADSYRGYVLPLPFVVYRGNFLRADREGARAVLLDTSFAELEVSLNASPPVYTDDSGARAGMRRVPATFEIGPKLRSTLLRTPGLRLNLEVPVRAVLTLESSPRHVGNVFTPNLDLSVSTGTPWRLGFVAGPLWASQGVNQRIYGVSAAEAIAGRPAYQARGGYGGWQALVGTSRRFERHWIGAFLRYDHVGGAVFGDSPLVRSRSNLSGGVAMSWIFANSSEQVMRPD